MKLACAVPSWVLLLCPDRPLLQVCFYYLFLIFIYSVWDQSLDFRLLHSTPTLVHPKARRIVLTTTVSQVVIRLTVLVIFKILIPITPSTANRYHHHVKQPNVAYFQLCSVLNPLSSFQWVIFFFPSCFPWPIFFALRKPRVKSPMFPISWSRQSLTPMFPIPWSRRSLTTTFPIPIHLFRVTVPSQV